MSDKKYHREAIVYEDLDDLEKELYGSWSHPSKSAKLKMDFPEQPSSEVTFPGTRSLPRYKSSHVSPCNYQSTESIGSSDSSPRSSTCKVSTQTICEHINTSEDNMTTSVTVDIYKKLKSRQDFALSLPTLDNDNYKEPMIVGRKDPPRDVIVMRNATKVYGSGKNKREVLKRLNMRIKEGSIYGLLGASGCGKTTLLSILVGLKSLDKKNGGDLYLFGGKPGDPRIGIPGKRVGYMPQELALYGEFSIAETFSYFGKIYGMDSSAIELKSQFLLNLLDLPNQSSRLIRNLSGGQQRRVSFAVSLIHNPELLILDEPTVGVDPMLRLSIWNYLETLSKDIQKTTIIITTHYIEEARQASVVGLMRHGKLLAQECPTSLLKKYNLGTLEEVFLKLCIKDTTGENEEKGNSAALKVKLNFLDEDKFKVNPFPEEYSACFDLNYKTTQIAPIAATLPKVAKMGKITSPRYRNVVYPGVTAGSMDNLSIHGLSYIKYPVENVPSEKLDFEEAHNIQLFRAIEQQKRADETMSDIVNSWMMGSSEVRCWSRSSFRNCFSLKRLWALMVKNLIKMCRNPVMLLFIFALPAIQVVFFCIAIGRDISGIKIAFVNEEVLVNVSKTPAFSGSLNDSLLEMPCPYTQECQFENLSCRYLRHLTNDSHGKIIVSSFNNFQEAYDGVKEGLFWAVVTVPYNFSVGILDRTYNGMESKQVSLNQSTIRINMDSSNQQINFVIQKSLFDIYTNFVEDLLRDCDHDEDLAKPPLHYGTPIYGPTEPNFTEFMAPGIILLIVFFLAVALTGEAFIAEKKDGLLDRSRIAGVSGLEIMSAQLLTQCIILIGQTATTLVFVLMVFSVPCKGPVIWVIILTFLQGITGMSFGFLVSILCSTEATAMQVSIGSFYPNLLLSGILWPVEGMPKQLQAVAWYLPCTCACQAMRDVMSRGWGITDHLSVSMGLTSSITWIVIFLSCSLICLKFQHRTA